MCKDALVLEEKDDTISCATFWKYIETNFIEEDKKIACSYYLNGQYIKLDTMSKSIT